VCDHVACPTEYPRECHNAYGTETESGADGAAEQTAYDCGDGRLTGCFTEHTRLTPSPLKGVVSWTPNNRPK
jgi:hypothetical protein